MRILPILFNTDMVRALLEERKTVTRRILKPQPLFYTGRRYVFADDVCPKKWEDCDNILDTYQYQPDDILYVRETWAESAEGYAYRADFDGAEGWGWRPSIHMPKKAARIFLRVRGLWVERLQEITEEQARAEGVGDPYDYQPPEWYEAHKELAHSAEIAAYAGLWNRLYAKPMPVKEHGVVVRYESYPWEDIQETRTYRGKPWLVIGNPWLWAIEFERIDRPEGWPGVTG